MRFSWKSRHLGVRASINQKKRKVQSTQKRRIRTLHLRKQLCHCHRTRTEAAFRGRPGILELGCQSTKTKRKVKSTQKRCIHYTSVSRQLRHCHRTSLTLRLLMSYIYIYIYMEHLFLMFLDHTQRRSTVGRTPLDE